MQNPLYNTKLYNTKVQMTEVLFDYVPLKCNKCVYNCSHFYAAHADDVLKFNINVFFKNKKKYNIIIK